MFQNSFSFEGRIRRSEFFFSSMIVVLAINIINAIGSTGGSSTILFIAYIPLFWFAFAQGAKRCHDRGNSGWCQIIPFYGLWMLLGDSERGLNEYGQNPKGII